jgi:RhoGEF domain
MRSKSEFIGQQKTYDRLCDQRNSGDSGVSVKDKLCVDKIKKGKRDYIIDELVKTEERYFNVLCVLKKNFMKPLSKLLIHEINIIFPKIEVKLNHLKPCRQCVYK